MRVTVLRHSETYFKTIERHCSLNVSTPSFLISGAPATPNASCASASMGSPCVSHPKRRSTYLPRIVW